MGGAGGGRAVGKKDVLSPKRGVRRGEIAIKQTLARKAGRLRVVARRSVKTVTGSRAGVGEAYKTQAPQQGHDQAGGVGRDGWAR